MFLNTLTLNKILLKIHNILNIFKNKFEIYYLYIYTINSEVLNYVNYNFFYWKTSNYASSNWFLYDCKNQNNSIINFK